MPCHQLLVCVEHVFIGCIFIVIYLHLFSLSHRGVESALDVVNGAERDHIGALLTCQIIAIFT